MEGEAMADPAHDGGATSWTLSLSPRKPYFELCVDSKHYTTSEYVRGIIVCHLKQNLRRE